MPSIVHCPDCFVRRNQYHEPYCEIFKLTNKPAWGGKPSEIPKEYQRR